MEDLRTVKLALDAFNIPDGVSQGPIKIRALGVGEEVRIVGRALGVTANALVYLPTSQSVGGTYLVVLKSNSHETILGNEAAFANYFTNESGYTWKIKNSTTWVIRMAMLFGDFLD